MLLVHAVCQAGISLLPVAWWPLASVVPVGLVVATFVVCLHDAVRCRDRYTVNSNYLVIETGLLSRITRSVPLSHVRDVTVTRSIFQRAFRFGTGDLVVRTANEAGTSEVGLSPLSAVTGLALRRSNKRLETVVLRDVPDPFRHAEILHGRLRAAADL
jgi:uncharacterized membrane protein YdbT with pleckstrin-like domain